VIPLYSRDEAVGVLGAAFAGRRPFSRDEFGLLMETSQVIAQTVALARHIEFERRISHALQESLLALPDEIPGVRLGHRYRAATDIPKVGGDFYDVFQMDTSVGVSIGDVSGKGLEAASVMSAAKNCVRVLLYDGHSPSETLQRANRFLGRILDPQQFVTQIVGGGVGGGVVMVVVGLIRQMMSGQSAR
jgi:serine phosphatase RsbU (regulator of sigma subunit)